MDQDTCEVVKVLVAIGLSAHFAHTQIEQMNTRRDFILSLSAAIGTARVGVPPIFTAGKAEKLPAIGLQLYTLRSLMKTDLERTLSQVAEIGYTEVEFAGYFGRSPGRVRRLLSENHLRSPSTHIAFPKDDDAWQNTLDEARAIGHEWVVIAWIDAPMRKTADDWKRVADRFNQLGTMAKQAGLRFGYHNHDFEFAKFGDSNGLELLLNGTDKTLVDFEMDLYWVVKAGGNPTAIISKHPKRFPLLHAKDATPFPQRTMVDVGAGDIDFRSIFSQRSMSGMQHVFVEHDEPKDPLESARASFNYLKALSY